MARGPHRGQGGPNAAALGVGGVGPNAAASVWGPMQLHRLHRLMAGADPKSQENNPKNKKNATTC